jgi:peptide-methionine (R)-S-oxide reductase
MKIKTILIWALRLLAAIILLQTLYFKFTAHPQSVALFTKIGLEPYGRIGIGIGELIVAILLLLPRAVALGALGGLGLMSGALFFHFTSLGIVFDGDAVLFIYASIVFICCAILLYVYRASVKEYIALVYSLKGKLQSILLFLFVSLFFHQCSNAQNKTAMTNKINPHYAPSDTSKLKISDAEWEKVLDPMVYAIAREKGTERAFTGEYWNHFDAGLYHCKACGNPLFRSNGKFESSCGWPSFFEPISPESIHYHEDMSHGMQRTEVTCGRCDAHLGHVFDDGPPPTYKRYCINSVIIDFEKEKK